MCIEEEIETEQGGDVKGIHFDKCHTIFYLNNADPTLTKFDPHFIAN